MMFAKTVCNPGSFVEVIPQGLLAKLQYNQNGLLEKIFLGYDDEDPVDGEVFRALEKFAPTTIPLSGGTTWVYGVFYIDNIPTDPGELPRCTAESYISWAAEGTVFTFYAGSVESLAASFQGSLAIRNWISMAGFNLLPGVVVPVEMSEDTIQHLITTGAYNFIYPYIAGYFVFNEGLEAEFIESGLHQCTVDSLDQFVAQDGYQKATLNCDDGKHVVNYSDVYGCNIQKGSTLLYYEDDFFNIVGSIPSPEAAANPVSNEFTCPVCGKKYIVADHGPVQCDDPNCLSVLYNSAVRMLSVLGLPSIEFARYEKAVKDQEILCLTDILVLPEYKEMKPEVTLADALKCILPVQIGTDDFSDKFANSCNQSVETVMYYANNPLRMETDLGMGTVQARKFVEWVQDGYNLSSLQTVLTSVSIKARSKKFEGAPIFRNNSFTITGKFKRGTYQDIAAIIESYSGTVYPDLETVKTNAVIVGGTNEEISGRVIKKARALGVPMIDEDEFFARYEIDKDLAENLL